MQSEKLQKFVKLIISAGYQIDKNTFNYLKNTEIKKDPTEILDNILKKMEKNKEKPLLLNVKIIEESFRESKKNVDDEKESYLLASKKQIHNGKTTFNPYSKDVETDLRIISDPTKKIGTDGKIENYLKYFQDRIKRIGKILRKRIDVKSAVTIKEALDSPENTKLRIIGIITEKKEYEKAIRLKIEDMNDSVSVLIMKNSAKEIIKKIQRILLDQVVCLYILKTRKKLLIVKDVIFPDIARRIQNKSSLPVNVVFTSDIHLGSEKFKEKAFKRFIKWLNGRYGNEEIKKIAGYVKYVIIAGDLVDGVGIYPNQIEELKIKDVYEQYNNIANYIEQIPEYIEVIIIPGNHDASRRALPQPSISKKYLEKIYEKRKIYSLGNPAVINTHNVEILMYHGGSLNDISSMVAGIKQDKPDEAMKILLKSRHLAPVYGGKTLIAPENKDFLIIERPPDIFHTGHVHVVSYNNYQGVTMVNSGCWQSQTDYQKMFGLIPTPGQVPIINLQSKQIKILSFI